MGGDSRFGYFCKGLHGNDCYSGIINQWGYSRTGPQYGWGIQNFKHHRYYNGHVSNTIRSPFTKIRVDHPAISGLPPVPRVYCSKFKTNYGKSLPFDTTNNAKACDETVPSKFWGNCVLYLRAAEIENRDSTKYGFNEFDRPVNRSVGDTEDFESFNAYKMTTQHRVTNGPGYKIMKMPEDLIELLLPFFNSTYASDYMVRHSRITGEFTNILRVSMKYARSIRILFPLQQYYDMVFPHLL